MFFVRQGFLDRNRFFLPKTTSIKTSSRLSAHNPFPNLRQQEFTCELNYSISSTKQTVNKNLAFGSPRLQQCL